MTKTKKHLSEELETFIFFSLFNLTAFLFVVVSCRSIPFLLFQHFFPSKTMGHEDEFINDCNQVIRKCQEEAETLALKSGHYGGAYDKVTSFHIGSLRAQIHMTKLKRNQTIKSYYSNYNKH